MARYHQPIQPCRFGCGGPIDDSVLHYLVCPVMERPAARYCRISVHSNIGSPLASLLHRLPHSALAIDAAVFVDCLLYSFDKIRNGSSMSLVALFSCGIKELMRRYTIIRRRILANMSGDRVFDTLDIEPNAAPKCSKTANRSREA